MANDATVFVSGNLIKEPTKNEVNGQPVISFTIAVNTTMKKADNSGYESNFYNVSYWGQRAVKLMERIQKGTGVEVTGDLVVQNYESKNGVKGQSLNITAYKVKPFARMKDATAQQSESPDDKAPF